MGWDLLWLLLFIVLMAGGCWALMRMMMGPRQRDREDEERDHKKE